MDLKTDYSLLAIDLERQELESGGNCSPQIYGQLLAIYLLTNDHANAKLLWKRTPAQLKHDTPELKAIWDIAKRLIERQVSGVYGDLQAYDWPLYLKNIMGALLDRTRERTVQLIGQSYSHIAVEDVRRMTGLNSEQEVFELVKQNDWAVDAANGFVLPKRLVIEESDLEKDSSQEQLQKLTEYVAFLENY